METSIYEIEYFREVKLSAMILSSRVEIIGMEVDLEKYRQKHGKNDKYIESMSRLIQIENTLSQAAMIDDENYMHRLKLADMKRKNNFLTDEIKRLNEKLAEYTKWESSN